jgi:Type of WD40 repeat
MFQEDIYPDSLSGEPSLASEDWFSGRDAPPRLLNMELVYRSGPDGLASRQRGFTPSAMPEPLSKSALPDHPAAKAVSTENPLSQKSSSTDMKTTSHADTKRPSSSEAEAPPAPMEGRQEPMAKEPEPELETQASEAPPSVNLLPV